MKINRRNDTNVLGIRERIRYPVKGTTAAVSYNLLMIDETTKFILDQKFFHINLTQCLMLQYIVQ